MTETLKGLPMELMKATLTVLQTAVPRERQTEFPKDSLRGVLTVQWTVLRWVEKKVLLMEELKAPQRAWKKEQHLELGSQKAFVIMTAIPMEIVKAAKKEPLMVV